ncbi:major facilitator transporter [Amycolatopsis mediterranei S699]|uniref:Putative proline/betaine transporter n=2 Tax=Amycolatopsis mediterranei TaxID=33910 RepID=A0A0H3DDB1_AMYMU|nr:MFS transporter [Amycolatopsis mediterranei]ADJ48212.1 major facilitator transporter [Amycolatopsis mediterranei U32]AEK45118.1 major facilitator transporter [Amycolatopsis mediterranei S699]AFO79923.1 major facilitator transporter [Amycolatopsis mediterranei S699]AGT87051.1 major facilitator transporter [Amycolatopsis mediterranei RB]KDO10698.1 MFS transporter [Amycolatopsis mediterranei]
MEPAATAPAVRPDDHDPARRLRRVVAASLVGTTIEWYDFFVYASAAGLVFSKQFFPALDSTAALLASFATFGVSFAARPIGGVIAGHLGDRFGRKGVLVATLVLMGISTVGVGLLPGYDAIGIAAPVLLVLLRLLQGLSAGGEWGGAALMAVEHAPPRRRGYFGSFPQIGVPIGLLLANLAYFTVSASTTKDQFQAWGWRIPFLLSVVLIGVGFLVRARVAESPVFTELQARRSRRSAPLKLLFKTSSRELIIAIGLFIANNLIGYILIAFITSYGTRTLKLSSTTMLFVGMVGAVAWGVFTLLAGRWSDTWGRRRTYLVGTLALALWTFPFFLLFDTRSVPLLLVAVVVLAFGLGLTYGPQAAAYAELFPTAIRYSGVSFAYAFGAVLGGGFAPLVATWLVGLTGTSLSVSAYMLVACLVTLAAVLALREGSAAEREAFVVATG